MEIMKGDFMEQIFLIKNGDLNEVNNALKEGGKVKNIVACAESTSTWAVKHDGVSGLSSTGEHGELIGSVYAYVVIELGAARL